MPAGGQGRPPRHAVPNCVGVGSRVSGRPSVGARGIVTLSLQAPTGRRNFTGDHHRRR